MNIDDLRLFVEVARRGGFAAVARARNADPAAVSRAISGLEARLGVRLFQRTTRRFALTEAGSLFLERIDILLDDFDGARDDARSVAEGPSGVLRLTASNAFGPMCIAPLLGEFCQRFPKVSIDLSLSDEPLDLVAERIDIAIRLGPLSGPGMVGIKLFDTCYRVCASPAYLAASPLPAPATLTTRRCLLFPFTDFRTHWTFVAPDGTSEIVAVDGDLVTSSALSLRAAAIAGMGPTLVPHWLVDADIACGDLIDVFPEFRVSATTFDTAAWLLYPSRNYLPAKVQAMSEFLLEHLRPKSDTIKGPAHQ